MDRMGPDVGEGTTEGPGWDGGVRSGSAIQIYKMKIWEGSSAIQIHTSQCQKTEQNAATNNDEPYSDAAADAAHEDMNRIPTGYIHTYVIQTYIITRFTVH